jgi:hypothetical protein
MLGACASPADPKAMVVAPQTAGKPFPKALQHTMCVRTVSGGEETSPLWVSKVDNASFKAGLSASLDGAGLRASAGCLYPIDVNLLGLSQPFGGFDMTVTSHVNYKVYNPAKAPILLETINTPYTATVSDAFVGAERMRKADEGSIRDSIHAFLDKLRNVDPDAPTLAPSSQESVGSSSPASVPSSAPAATATSQSIEDTSHLPHSNETMIVKYREFLTRPLPRAFAISENGESWMAWGLKDAPIDTAHRALRLCQGHFGHPCFLYAVDNDVVFGSGDARWNAEAEKSGQPDPIEGRLATSTAIEDTTALPHSSPKMIDRYTVFLSRPLPRAFAISDNGNWSMAWDLKKAPIDTYHRAVLLCEGMSGHPCFLYAADNDVVYKAQ